jgi:methanogenic corrinoid protein MtbC1
VIPTQYTSGGHRRIPLNGLLDFLRTSEYVLVRPEVLGLPATIGQTSRVIERAQENFTQALVRGDEEQCRLIVWDLYLAEHSIATICDQVFAQSFHEIGKLWECGTAEVYQERRSCEVAARVLYELRSLLSQPVVDAPLAIGGSPGGDPYNLANTMAELVLRDGKWNATSLGNNLPFNTLSAAIKTHRPRLFWLSCTHILDVDAFLSSYQSLYEEFSLDVAFVVGGQALTDDVRQQMKYTAFCDNMRHLEAIAQTLLGSVA